MEDDEEDTLEWLSSLTDDLFEIEQSRKATRGREMFLGLSDETRSADKAG